MTDKTKTKLSVEMSFDMRAAIEKRRAQMPGVDSAADYVRALIQKDLDSFMWSVLPAKRDN